MMDELSHAAQLRHLADDIEIEDAYGTELVTVLRRLVGACPWQLIDGGSFKEFHEAMLLAQKMVTPARLDEQLND